MIDPEDLYSRHCYRCGGYHTDVEACPLRPQGEQEPVMYKPMYTLEEVEQLARDDETEPAMYKCEYCQAYHMVSSKEFYCPLDPNRVQ